MTPPDPRPQTAPPKSDDPARAGASGAEQPVAPPKPLLELRDPLPEVLDSVDGTAELAARFGAGTGPFAIDAERASGYRYSQRAYLVQMRREGAGTALIDPIPFGDVPNSTMAALNDAVAGSEWI